MIESETPTIDQLKLGLKQVCLAEHLLGFSLGHEEFLCISWCPQLSEP